MLIMGIYVLVTQPAKTNISLIRAGKETLTSNLAAIQ